MDFKEFKEQDAYNAFAEFITVAEAKIRRILPESYHSIFNDKCECGSDMIIKENRKQLMCCNPRCKIKLGYMLAETFTRFSVSDLGVGTCKPLISRLYDNLKYKSHLEVLLLEPEQYPRILTGSKAIDFTYGVNKIKGSKLTLGSIISKLAIPKLDKSASDIFEEFSNVDEFVDAIENAGGMLNFLAIRGIHDLQKAFYIKEFLPDFYLAEVLMQGNIKDIALSKIRICLTGRLKLNGSSITKNAFIDYINEQSIAKDGKVLYEFEICSAKDTVPYIIYSLVSTDDKFLTGKKREQRAKEEGQPKQILMKPEELYNKVRKVVDMYERELGL